ncbi:MAG: PEP-CTERM sorting domain-containing protein [Acidobacteriia bacterium]|nr:PEP-CTERM sorting domain-containing protein [Terriglobia bacterium]MBV8906360.1 PEP-CTERM sorting domain-containing protein [Terriglobia bacterium]
MQLLKIGALSSLLLFFVSTPCLADLLIAGENPLDFGDLNQHDTNCNNVACGPTAATNSFVFLQNMYPAIYDMNLVPHIPGGTMYQDEVDVANELSNIMHTCNLCNPGAGGTYIEDFIAGKQAYMNMVAPNMTVFAAQMNFAWRPTDPDGNNVGPKPAYVMDNTVPTSQFIASQINAGEDVEIFLAGDIDHYVTLFDFTFDTTAHTGQIGYIDPDTGNIGFSNITGQDASGYLEVAYGTNSEVIAHAVAESPVPEPATWLCTAAGLAAIIIRRRMHATS